MIWLLAYVLIELHGPGNRKFEVKVDEIVSFREPAIEEHFAKGTRCIVNTSDGKFSAVTEDCDTVRRLIEGERK